MKLAPQELSTEFDRQSENLVRKKYPETAGLSIRRFRKHIEPLRDQVETLDVSQAELKKGRLAFVIVIKSDWVATEKAMSLVGYEGKNGSTKMYPRQPSDFQTIAGVSIPSGMAYLLVDIDRGGKYINLPPDQALIRIKKQNRSPLTIDEGVALVTQYPDFLVKNNCFSLLASRYSGDRRVPAIWINREKRAHLGWCWDGNPHSWLGSASCSSRIGT